MDVDLESASSKRIYASVINDADNSVLPFRRLDSELSLLAKTMLRALGRAQGPKYTALLSDAVISDFFEASLRMPNFPSSYVDWLHEWVGTLVVARELTMGAFSSSQDQSTMGFPGSKKQHRILLSLAMAVLPLTVDSILWKLPISTSQVEGNAYSAATPKVLEANSCVAILLLEFVRNFCHLLRPEDMDAVVPTILFPVVEKASQKDVPLVQEAAMETLVAMGKCLGRKSTGDLLFLELHRLVAAMIGRLRLPGGLQTPGQNDAREILTIANALRWILESMTRTTFEIKMDDSKNERSNLVNLMSLLEFRLDHLIRQKNMRDDDFDTLCSLHKAFFDFFLLTFGVQIDYVYSYRMPGMEPKTKKYSWLDALSKFHTVSSTKYLHESFPVKNNAGTNKSRVLCVSESDVSLYSRIIARDCYLLSNESLKIRISSCQSMGSGFKFLAFVGSIHEVRLKCRC